MKKGLPYKGKKYQQGGTVSKPTNLWTQDKRAWTDSILSANVQKPWVKNLYNPNIEQPEMQWFPHTNNEGVTIAPSQAHYNAGAGIPFQNGEQADYFIDNQQYDRTPIPQQQLQERFPQKKQTGGKVAVPPLSRWEYVQNKYPTMFKRYPGWTNNDEQGLDDRTELVQHFEGIHTPDASGYPINPRTLTPAYVPAKYSDYSNMNKPQFQELGYKEGAAPVGDSYQKGGAVIRSGFFPERQGWEPASTPPVSVEGYRSNSPDRHEPFLNINSNNISMKGVQHKVLGIDNTGKSVLMVPGQDYQFPGTQVTEYPIRNKMQKGGKVNPPIYTNDPKDPRLQRYQEEVPTKQFIPQLPAVTDQGYNQWVQHLQGPEMHIQDADKMPKPVWQDRARGAMNKLAHTDINGQMTNESNNYTDLLTMIPNAALNLTQPSRYNVEDHGQGLLDRIINTMAPLLMDIGTVGMMAPESYASKMRAFRESGTVDIHGPNAYKVGELPGTRPWPERQLQPPQRNWLEKGIVRGFQEVDAIPQVIKQAKNFKKILTPGQPLAPEEANLLKNTRLVGSITHSGGEESARLTNILSRAQNMSDRDLQALTGMSKGEIQQRLETLRNAETIGKKVENTQERFINLERPPGYRQQQLQEYIDRFGINNSGNISLGESNTHEYINNLRSPQPQQPGLSGYSSPLSQYLRDIPDELHIDPAMLYGNIQSGGANPYIKKGPTMLANKVYNKWAENKRAGFVSETNMPVTQALIPSIAKQATNNPAAEMLRAYKKVQDAPKGTTFIPAHSLSADSYPMSMRLIQKAHKEGVGDINYHGHDYLNNLGFPSKAGLDPNIILRENNTLIDKLNQGRSQKIPYGYIENGMVKVPKLTVTKKQLGGWLNRY